MGFTQNGGSSQVQSSKPTALSVRTTTVEPVRSFLKRRTFTGVLKASRTSELGFERSGRLIAVLVNEGDRVTEGTVLAKIDVENLTAKHQELKAQRSAAQSLLDELEAGPRKQTIAAARAEVRGLQAEVDLGNLELNRRMRSAEACDSWRFPCSVPR